MKIGIRKKIPLDRISPHPCGRCPVTDGEDWKAFEESIADEGILEEMEVRRMPSGDYQCLQGHRRLEAAKRRKVETAWCRVVIASEADALRILWDGNDHRESLNLADQASLIRSMVQEGGSIAEIALMLKRRRAWVKKLSEMAELGSEVLAAVSRKGRDRLTMEAVEEILKVPAELRPQAVQQVLHPELETGTLDWRQARDVLQKCLIEPSARVAAWDKDRLKVLKGWRKRLEALCLPKTKEALIVDSRGVAEASDLRPGFVPAEELVPSDWLGPDAPAGLLWLHLAVKHGVAVVVLPGTGGVRDPGESRAVVNQRLLLDAEAAIAQPIERWRDGEKVRCPDSAGTAWLRSGRNYKRAIPEEERARKGNSKFPNDQSPSVSSKSGGSKSPKSSSLWEEVADDLEIPTLFLGKLDGREMKIQPLENGHCRWVGINDAAAIKGAQKAWLQNIRKKKGWDGILIEAKVSQRHWEGWELGRPISFAKAVALHLWYRQSQSGC